MLVLPILTYPKINPVLISIGPFSVRWYALAYIAGILAGWYYARIIIASKRLWGGPAPFTVTDFDDFIIWITLGIILGGRIGYVLFYNLGYFAANPLEIFALWTGGMSFHGGVIGCIVVTVLVRAPPRHSGPFARRRNAGGRPDRPLPWSSRQLHQRRIMGPADRRALGYGLSLRAGRFRDIPASFMKRPSKACSFWSCSG